jgi:hypothetical protein
VSETIYDQSIRFAVFLNDIGEGRYFVLFWQFSALLVASTTFSTNHLFVRQTCTLSVMFMQLRASSRSRAFFV